jgi:hypothetical protein
MHVRFPWPRVTHGVLFMRPTTRSKWFIARVTASSMISIVAAGCASDYELTGRTPSPTGVVIAITYVRSGGGGPGWCDERVALVSREDSLTPAEIDKKERGYVFSVSCNSHIKLTWISDTELQISYAIDSVISTTQWKSGLENRVHLIYVPRS